MTSNKHRQILVVARWPLGGIRTYMRYIFLGFPTKYNLTLIVSSTHEDAALIEDARTYRARLIFVKRPNTRRIAAAVFKELRKNCYDVIISQGYITAVAVSAANLIFRLPHILTIHGIVEKKYLAGRLSCLKRSMLHIILSETTVLYAVSNDILCHLYELFPKLKNRGPLSIVIPNGINTCELKTSFPEVQLDLHTKFGLDEKTFLFGYFGRFMPEKGFDLLIEAVSKLRLKSNALPFGVVAVGSGDYIREYQKKIHEMELEQYFFFLPFQAQVQHLYQEVNTIVMPSRWEASGLLAMEVLCNGRPLIASKCIGLRETIKETPSRVFPPENVEVLANIMFDCMVNSPYEEFQRFVPHACARFDVANSTEKLVNLIENIS